MMLHPVFEGWDPNVVNFWGPYSNMLLLGLSKQRISVLPKYSSHPE